MTASFSEDARTDGRATGEAHLPCIQQSAVSRPRSLRLPQVIRMTGLKKRQSMRFKKPVNFRAGSLGVKRALNRAARVVDRYPRIAT
jgi:hypothetical protein